MKEVNVKVLIPDDVDLKKIINLSLVAKYQKKDDEWRFVTMPFVLSDSAENRGEKTDGDLTLKEVKQMCESRDCGDCSFSLSCHRLFKGMPSQWLEIDLNEGVKPNEVINHNPVL